MRHRFWLVTFLLFVVVALAMSPFAKADPAKEIPKEVSALVGTYSGSWTMYGVDEKGNVVRRMSWTDTMKAFDPVIKGDQASVSTTDEMTFDGAGIPSFQVQGKEGYYIGKDNGLGDYFIETTGQTHRMVKVGENVWSYTTPVVPQEVGRLGLPKGATGRHVLVKVITNEKGLETHRISRLTTVSWNNSEGNEQALQFVSLQGHHRRQP